MIKKLLHYKIEGQLASSVRKVLAQISDNEFKSKFCLSDKEMLDIYEYLKYIDIEEDSTK